MAFTPAFAATAAPLPVRARTLSHSCSVTPTMGLRLPGSGFRFRVPNLRFPFGRSGGSNLGSGSGMGSSGFGSGGPGNGRRSGSGGRADGGGGGGVLGAAWTGYNSALDSKPILTKAVTSLIGFALGDLLAQKFLGDGGDVDVKRLLRMASFGLLFHGPSGHYFYGALDRVIVGKGVAQVVSKVAIDQVLWAPIFTSVFFAYLGVAEGKSKDAIITKIKNDTWIGVKTSWKFWPAAHTINFALIPTNQRLLYINTLQVGYNVILSMLGNKE